MLKIFWPFSQSNSRVVSIPNYLRGEHEDSIDLQIKSLIYMFKRFSIQRLGPFLHVTENGEHHLTYIDELDDEDTINHDNKLDTIYNKSQFEKQLIMNEHRILIDFIKNKFRSMLILSDYPKELNTLPELSEDITFKFSVLSPTASNEEYIQVLLNESNFYIEHSVSDDLKIELITSLLYDQRAMKQNSVLDKDDREYIISSYLKQLAFHIQVDRIFKASLRSKEKISSPEQQDLSYKHLQQSVRLHPPKQVTAKPSIIKSQPGENSYVTKPVPLFLTSPTVRYQSPSRRKGQSPVLESSPAMKNGSKVSFNEDSIDEATPQSTPQTSPQRVLRASPSRMKLRNVDQPLPTAPLAPSRSTSPQRGLNKKASMSILKMDAKFQEQQQQGLHQNMGLNIQKRRNSVNSSSASDFSDNGSSHATSFTNFSLEQNMFLSDLDRDALYEQSRAAVKIRIERERNSINGEI